ncbi:MAG: SDR family oxidoreductase [Hyphomicrobiales bacterium]
MSGLLLVTGGSRGIGAAIAIGAAKCGFDVCLTYRTDKRSANKIVDQISVGGGIAFAVQADAASEADTLKVFEQIDARGIPLTALVNNAGVVDVATPLKDMSVDRIERMMGTNVIGPMIYAREAINRMSTEAGGKGGSIVNISSMAANGGRPNQYIDYAASKAAIDALTKGLALEVVAGGIRVNGVRPGLVDTDIHASGGQPDRAHRLADTIPMKRPGTAQEIADCVLFLISNEASYVTGAILDVSGGR